ncbi:MAG: hypothetical protein ACK5LJ_17160 [Paracoccus sp. (in: a-proteobacteria)]
MSTVTTDSIAEHRKRGRFWMRAAVAVLIPIWAACPSSSAFRGLPQR